MATSNDLMITQEEGIMIITLNRPERLNAITLDMGDSLLKILETVGQDKEVKALVITGAGRGFCSGADVTGQEERIKWSTVERNEWRCVNPFLKFPLMLRNLDKPVIAAVNGVAVGAGFALTLGCDIRIASENARFSMMFVKRALIPDMGSTYFLPRLVGAAKACEMMFTGDMVDAKEALRIGLVNKVVPAEELMKATKEMASRIAKGPAITIRLIKHAVYQGVENSLETQLDVEAYADNMLYLTEDHQEGVRAFLEKREPVFKGR